jgi:hypothetical protein
MHEIFPGHQRISNVLRLGTAAVRCRSALARVWLKGPVTIAHD